QLGLFSLILVLVFTACKYQPEQWQKPRLVVATTGIVGDILHEILPESNYEIHTLMGPGVDPHSYDARPSDIRALGNADVIVYSGLHLEGKFVKIFKKIQKEKTVLAFASGIPESKLISVTSTLHDPHVWLDPVIWNQGLRYIGKQLAKKYPEDSMLIMNRVHRYSKKLMKTDSIIREKFKKFNSQQKVLITSHDAFHYFGKSYGVEVLALQGVSTVSEPGITTVSNLTQTIVQRKIKSLFIENSVSPKSIRALKESCKRQGHLIKTGGELYSDALGGPDSGADTYLKMILKNAETICKGWNYE
ncbi:MAG: zinc ABC transporter substrate-binding protein, partial [Bacteroidetes bacterium]|nr:zinc ABC transporter substrate-binding protein [Bacteroidota bacterium]